MWLRVIGLVSSLVIGLWAEAHAANFGGKDRMRVAAPDGSPYAAIGRVSWRNSRGTGFLVSECHVLTAKHIISDKKSALGRRVRFKVGLQSGKTVSSEGNVIADGTFDVRARRTNPTLGRDDDWMLVALDECIGRELGYLNISSAGHTVSTAASLPLRSAGYPNGHQAQLVIDPSCKVWTELGKEWLHDCSTFPGDSGGPLFREVSAGGRIELCLLGMITSGWSEREKGVFYSNRATKVSYLADKLEQYVGSELRRLTNQKCD